MVDLTPIFSNFLYAVASLTLIIIMRFIVLGVNKLFAFLNLKTEQIENNDFKTYCKEMINAAETMTKELTSGAEKKDWVTKQLIMYCKAKELIFTEDQISNLIQAIFNELDGVTVNKKAKTSEIEKVVNTAVEKTMNNVTATTAAVAATAVAATTAANAVVNIDENKEVKETK